MTINAQREKYMKLMAHVEDLEERVIDMEKELQVMAESPDPRDLEVTRATLGELQEELANARQELTRVSDGCGKPHAH